MNDGLAGLGAHRPAIPWRPLASRTGASACPVTSAAFRGSLRSGAWRLQAPSAAWSAAGLVMTTPGCPGCRRRTSAPRAAPRPGRRAARRPAAPAPATAAPRPAALPGIL